MKKITREPVANSGVVDSERSAKNTGREDGLRSSLEVCTFTSNQNLKNTTFWGKFNRENVFKGKNVICESPAGPIDPRKERTRRRSNENIWEQTEQKNRSDNNQECLFIREISSE